MKNYIVVKFADGTYLYYCGMRNYDGDQSEATPEMLEEYGYDLSADFSRALPYEDTDFMEITEFALLSADVKSIKDKYGDLFVNALHGDEETVKKLVDAGVEKAEPSAKHVAESTCKTAEPATVKVVEPAAKQTATSTYKNVVAREANREDCFFIACRTSESTYVFVSGFNNDNVALDEAARAFYGVKVSHETEDAYPFADETQAKAIAMLLVGTQTDYGKVLEAKALDYATLEVYDLLLN